MQELVLRTLPSSVGDIVLWSVLGTVAGLAFAALVAWLLFRLGAFRLDWRHARWVRALAAAWLLVVGLAAGGAVGGCEGALRGYTRTVADETFRKGPLASAGACVSAGVAWLDLKLQGVADPAPALDAYLHGRRTLDVPAFYGRLGKAETMAVDALVAQWNGQAQARLGLPASPVVDALLQASLRLVAQRVVRAKAEDVAKDLQVLGVRDGFFAALEGGAGTHAALSERLIDRCLVPLAVLPARIFVRSQQVAAGGIGLALLAVPVLGFWIGRWAERRNGCTKPAGSAILPGNGGPTA
jgi:hypothetical protein